MKIFFTYTITVFLLFFTQLVFSQDAETTASGQDVTEQLQTQQLNENEEVLSFEELRAAEKESKMIEREAKQEAREAKRLERQIQKTRNAEARAIKARRDADNQAEKTKTAIDKYLND